MQCHYETQFDIPLGTHALTAVKLQMFGSKIRHVWHAIRTCFFVSCPRLDATNGNCQLKVIITISVLTLNEIKFEQCITPSTMRKIDFSDSLIIHKENTKEINV